MKEAMQTVRFGKTAKDPKTRYEQTNEERLNDNFRMLQEAIEELQAEVKRLRSEG